MTKQLRILFPIYLLMDESTFVPFVMANRDGTTILPILGSEQNANSFCMKIGLRNFIGASVISAINLQRLLNGLPVDHLTHVWLNDRIVDVHTIEFQDRLGIDDFLSVLRQQADMENKRHQN